MDGEIVNADSMQVYRDLATLTARPTPEDEARAPHHLFGFVDGAEPWSVGRWLRATQARLAEIAARGRTAIVVGGTGLYFLALTRGLADIPQIDDIVRARARDLVRTEGEAGARRALQAADPRSAAEIAPADGLRLARALEVVWATGRPIGDWRAQTRPTLAPGAYRAAALDPPRDALYARCDARLGAMLAAGALDEVATLVARGLDPELPVMKALGVRPLARHLAGELDLAEALDVAQRETRRYAKRQATWFRHQSADWPRIAELGPEAQWAALGAFASPFAP